MQIVRTVPPLQWFFILSVWGLFLVGAIADQRVVLTLGTVTADFLGAFLLYLISTKTPKAWQQTMLGFALGMLVIGLSDLAVLVGLEAVFETLLSVLGALIFLLASLALPLLLEQQGMYKKGFAWQIILIAAAIAILVSALFTILFQPPVLRIVYQTTGLFLTSLFIMQSQDFAGGTIGRVLRMLSIAFALSSFSQVAVAIMPSLFAWDDTNLIPHFVRQFFWTAGMTLLAFVSSRK
jgi:hypothetical protein